MILRRILKFVMELVMTWMRKQFIYGKNDFAEIPT